MNPFQHAGPSAGIVRWCLSGLIFCAIGLGLFAVGAAVLICLIRAF